MNLRDEDRILAPLLAAVSGELGAHSLQQYTIPVVQLTALQAHEGILEAQRFYVDPEFADHIDAES